MVVTKSKVLPPHVDPCADRDSDCGGSIFDVVATIDGCTTDYVCELCGEPLADLICGAEP